MHILIVEDDRFKLELIEQEVLNALPTSTFVYAKSVQQAVKLVNQVKYDFVILDIALPSHPTKPGGGQPISQPSGGVEILLELSYAVRADKVIIVTQYPEIEYDGALLSLADASSIFKEQLHVNICDVVHFNADDSVWKDRLTKALKS